MLLGYVGSASWMYFKEKKIGKLIVPDSWEFNLRLEDRRHWVGEAKCDPWRRCHTSLWQLPVALLGFFLV